jgi:hypothetical protein
MIKLLSAKHTAIDVMTVIRAAGARRGGGACDPLRAALIDVQNVLPHRRQPAWTCSPDRYQDVRNRAPAQPSMPGDGPAQARNQPTAGALS